MGGSTSSKTTVPKYMEEAGKDVLDTSRDVFDIGYTPYYGPDVAAFTPMQEQAFQNTADMASAFGMNHPDNVTGMPPAQEFAGGIRGYSSAPMFEESLERFKAARPAQYDAISGMFIDPVTGEGGRFAQQDAETAAQNTSTAVGESRVEQALTGKLPVRELTPKEYQAYIFEAANRFGR